LKVKKKLKNKNLNESLLREVEEVKHSNEDLSEVRAAIKKLPEETKTRAKQSMNEKAKQERTKENMKKNVQQVRKEAETHVKDGIAFTEVDEYSIVNGCYAAYLGLRSKGMNPVGAWFMGNMLASSWYLRLVTGRTISETQINKEVDAIIERPILMYFKYLIIGTVKSASAKLLTSPAILVAWPWFAICEIWFTFSYLVKISGKGSLKTKRVTKVQDANDLNVAPA